MPQPKVEKQEPKLSLDTPKPSEKELKALTGISRAMAWSVHRWPTERRICEYNTKIHLPRTYLSTKGEDVRPIRKGTDINQLVHRHYMDTFDGEKNEDWVNYVHADDVVMRKHEYLGPDPRVAGYYFDGYGELHVRWWDGFLKDQWMGKDKWSLNVTLNTAGKWVVKED
ncbi:hypothetical protein HYDPIDRAFT_175870 [Hydnomerulius pinastri MD-312]|uniref:Uncharacterized protein n=1 Tax=Hydnomerulius pinastri MD-312 TaxID=994086 RepID=A0A0C9VE85_9AGAM|nr:hypothetical protein HYDPIDRAFT_175870 [Hydnomerulius pinastri MD-312]